MAGKLVFCFPYRGVGGISVLFLRLAEALGARGIPTAIVDYADGYMARRHDPKRTQLLEYREGGRTPIPVDATIVLQAMTPWSIFPNLDVDASTRIWFWNCHPFNLVPTLPGFRRWMQSSPALGSFVLATVLRSYRSKIRRFLALLLERDSIAFMDRTNIAVAQDYLRIDIDEPRMLAIPAPAAERRTPIAMGDALRVVWIGRLVDFKYYPLTHLLRRLDQVASKVGRKVRIDIIGGGDHEAELLANAGSFPTLELRFFGEMEQAEVEHHLRHHADLLCAMGTSALEGARLGVPTLLLDLSYGPVVDGYRFSWLHELDGYGLAEVARATPGTDSASSLLARLRELDSDPGSLADAAYDYFERHHDLGLVSDRLLDLVSASRCSWGDLVSNGMLGRGIVYHVFSKIRAGVA